jgi:hypothetical protein
MSTVKKQRFSKQVVYDYLVKRIDKYIEEYKFDPNNGRSQIHGQSVERIREYGNFESLLQVLEDLQGGYIS